MSAPLMTTFKRWSKFELGGLPFAENNLEAYALSPTSCFLRQAGLVDDFGDEMDEEDVDLYQAAVLIMALIDQFTSRFLTTQQSKV